MVHAWRNSELHDSPDSEEATFGSSIIALLCRNWKGLSAESNVIGDESVVDMWDMEALLRN